MLQLSKTDLENYGKVIDNHIRSLIEVTHYMREIKTALDELRLAQEGEYRLELNKLQQNFEILTSQLEQVGLPKTDTYETEFSIIRKKITEEDWPLAIRQDLINYDPEEKAETILDMLVMDHFNDRKFLDYGCRSGHTVNVAAKRGASLAVGFDLDPNWQFSDTDKMLFSSDLDYVGEHGPYDIILLYDILDHCENPIEVLQNVKNLLAENGKIYIRCHPWCSRHGGHLHEKINKAYLHLIFNDVELTRLGYECKPTNKLLHPLQSYHQWFDSAGLSINLELPIEGDVEPYFLYDNILYKRLQRLWENENIASYIAIHFVDYVLEKSTESGQKIF